MQLVTVELLNDRALKLLKELEEMNILRLITQEKSGVERRCKWAGTISQETGDKMLKHVDEDRDSWERNI